MGVCERIKGREEWVEMGRIMVECGGERAELSWCGECVVAWLDLDVHS